MNTVDKTDSRIFECCCIDQIYFLLCPGCLFAIYKKWNWLRAVIQCVWRRLIQNNEQTQQLHFKEAYNALISQQDCCLGYTALRCSFGAVVMHGTWFDWIINNNINPRHRGDNEFLCINTVASLDIRLCAVRSTKRKHANNHNKQHIFFYNKRPLYWLSPLYWLVIAEAEFNS